MPKNPNGHEYTYKLLSPSTIRMDPLYQRPLDAKRVAKIVKEFDGDVFNEPKVSFRGGAYWCFDGQHSVAAWRQLHKGQDKALYCKVFMGMTWLDEEEAFVKQNGYDKDPTTNEKLKAQFHGGNLDVMGMVNAAKVAGYIVDFSQTQGGGRIIATSALFRAYQQLGASVFAEMLSAMNSSWGSNTDAVSAYMINGCRRFYFIYHGDFSNDSFISKMKKVPPSTIIMNAKGQLSGSSERRCALELLKTYNSKRSANRLDENKLLLTTK